MEKRQKMCNFAITNLTNVAIARQMNEKYYMRHLTVLLLLFVTIALGAAEKPSVAGFFPINNQGRMVWDFNPQWRFHLGDADGAWRADYDDSGWEVVSTPHCVKLEPAESSGGRNYQGVAWYRKVFTAPADHDPLLRGHHGQAGRLRQRQARRRASWRLSASHHRPRQAEYWERRPLRRGR